MRPSVLFGAFAILPSISLASTLPLYITAVLTSPSEDGAAHVANWVWVVLGEKGGLPMLAMAFALAARTLVPLGAKFGLTSQPLCDMLLHLMVAVSIGDLRIAFSGNSRPRWAYRLAKLL